MPDYALQSLMRASATGRAQVRYGYANSLKEQTRGGCDLTISSTSRSGVMPASSSS
jgi:hypothetical protein